MVEPKLGRIYRGSEKVAVKVTSKQLFPTVPGCDPRPSKPVDTCIVRVPYDVVTISLTCKVEHVKPAVDILWFHVLPDGGAEQVESSTTILPVSRPGASFDNTFTSLSTFHLPMRSDDIVRYRCEAHGVAVGSDNGSHLLVSVRNVSPIVHTSPTVYLERGRRGIVSCLPDSPFAYKLKDLDCVFWYFGSRDREHAIGSYPHDTISPLDDIRLGVNSSTFDLVIQNVSDSDEGKYFYTVVPKVGRLYKQAVGVAVKVSAKKPFPVVPECLPQQSEPGDECVISVPHDMVNVTLTCKVEHAKPPVAVQWFMVFQDGHKEDAESTETMIQTVPSQPGSFFDNTYTTVSSLYLSTTVNDSLRCRCEASGVAAGGENGRQITVTIRRNSATVRTETTETTSPDLQNNPCTFDVDFLWKLLFAITFAITFLSALGICIRRRPKCIKRVKRAQNRQRGSTIKAWGDTEMHSAKKEDTAGIEVSELLHPNSIPIARVRAN
ncbi:uncharacterized protein LOC110980815 [Acanthaster planci]|uniref:Uncharacterized protein LOC110980815 n=1 Tax=Acanthaster planci TaxID=133434 RepID=A0A8B7YJT5_ACAPL|nr:uncharacterized protein LOC110980815 [Acanthaster planci]